MDSRNVMALVLFVIVCGFVLLFLIVPVVLILVSALLGVV
jgi:hypothetical protein